MAAGLSDDRLSLTERDREYDPDAALEGYRAHQRTESAIALLGMLILFAIVFAGAAVVALAHR